MSKYTREDIEALKLRDPKTLTGEERRLVNLSPIEPGKTRNPKGRKKGSKNWSTHFQQLMMDGDFLKTIIKKLPGNWDGIVGDTPADVIAAGLIASIARSIGQSISDGKPISRDTKDAIALLNKIAYGDKIVHEDPDGIFEKTSLNFMVVPSRPEDIDESDITE